MYCGGGGVTLRPESFQVMQQVCRDKVLLGCMPCRLINDTAYQSPFAFGGGFSKGLNHFPLICIAFFLFCLEGKEQAFLNLCKMSLRNGGHSVVYTKSRPGQVLLTEAIFPLWIIVFWAIQDFISVTSTCTLHLTSASSHHHYVVVVVV